MLRHLVKPGIDDPALSVFAVMIYLAPLVSSHILIVNVATTEIAQEVMYDSILEMWHNCRTRTLLKNLFLIIA
jgi:hypothetical protein